MLKTLTSLKTNPIIRSFQIFDFKSGSDFYYFKAKAVLTDNSDLFLKEFVSRNEFIHIIGKL